jgi:dipeptidyl aminopeptidase/acylaminoacyl peptidase
MKHKHIFTSLLGISLISITTYAQELTIPVADNLVAKIPGIPASIAEDVKPYTEARGASFATWHPVLKEMLIQTRFGNTPQVHRVKMPGGDRKQLTFFDEAPGAITIQPTTGDYFLYSKDKGGSEFTGLYRYDFATGKSTLLAGAPRSQNESVTWNKAGSKIIYTSTRRNSADRDLYMMDPLKPETDKKLLELTGGGWAIADWSDDESLALLTNYVSVNEVQAYIYQMATGKLTKILPKKDERAVYDPIKFTPDNKSIYVITTTGSEYKRPAQADVKTGKLTWLVKDINWDVEAYSVTDDGSKAAFVTNEAGQSRLYIQDLATKKYVAVTALPVGVIDGIGWHNNNTTLGLTVGTVTSSSDAYDWDTTTKKLTRWTESELGGMSLDGIDAPELVKWKSFDGLEISGFLYRANKKFTGPRPVIIAIHGGPEGQSQPVFAGRNNYYLNELGIDVILPNVRGSVGYGKTFTDLDNGFKREDSVKDLGALIDWIATQPGLDASRIMLMGGSYGGYMTLAGAYHFNDKIKCSVDIVGISNFNTFLKNTESYRRDLRRVEYGDERDPKMAAFFEKTAPLTNASKIQKPIFIIQGKNDPRVPYTEAEQMVQKIEAGKGTVWYLMANDEGHGFRKKNNQDFQFYAVTAFIKEYLLK